MMIEPYLGKIKCDDCSFKESMDTHVFCRFWNRRFKRREMIGAQCTVDNQNCMPALVLKEKSDVVKTATLIK